MQQRLHLCTTAVKLLKDNSSLTPLAAAESAYDEAADGDSDEEQEPIISFVQAQVSAWMEVTQLFLNMQLKPNPASLMLPCSEAITSCVDASNADSTLHG